MSCEGAIDSVIAEMLNVKAVAETVDFSIQEYAFNILEKRGITVIPSILLAVSGNILNYLEFLQKKRGEEMTKSEVEMRFESFQMQMESLLAPDISGNSLTKSLYSKAVGNYEKKYRILYGEKTKE
jgi:glutamate dehydrogenase/leucine dehydrogenase